MQKCGESARRPAEMATADLPKDSKPPLTLRPNFKCEKGSVTADKPPVCPAGEVLLIENAISSGDIEILQYRWNANSFLFLLLMKPVGCCGGESLHRLVAVPLPFQGRLICT